MISFGMPITTRLSAVVFSRQISLTARPAPPIALISAPPVRRRGRIAAFPPLKFLYPRRSRFSDFPWLDLHSADARKSKQHRSYRPPFGGVFVSLLFIWRVCAIIGGRKRIDHTSSHRHSCSTVNGLSLTPRS